MTELTEAKIEELCRRLEECEHKEVFICDPCSGSRVITIKPYNRDGTEAASLIRRLVQERDEARIELGNAGEDYREQEAKLRNTFFDAQSMKARATTAEAEAESWKSQFHSAAEAASMYVEFYEQHHADFDPAGNYIPHSQIDGDLRAAKAEAERLRAERGAIIDAFDALGDAWNSLPFGKHKPEVVSHWVKNQIAPALERLRESIRARTPLEGKTDGK